MIKDVLRLTLEANLSQERTARALGISKGVVNKYLALAAGAGLTQWPDVQDLDEHALELRLMPTPSKASTVVVPDFGRVHQELRRKGVTLTLLWEEYVDAHPGQPTWQRTQFCEHYRRFAKTLKRSMRQVHLAGEKLFVDFAGPTVPLSDGGCANVFVAALGASSYTYACATPTQKLVDWIHGMVGALHFIEGVPQLVVPDNPRALIADPNRYEPRANETVLDFSRHYATSVLPARPRKPQDKAKAESAVQVVERWILARLRHRRFDSVADVDEAITELLPLLNNRPFQKLPGSRASTYLAIDRPALAALPPSRYEFARYKVVKVNIDYHVEVDGHYYSVPHQLVGQELDVRITTTSVECLHRGQRVAAHRHCAHRGKYTTVEAHLPAAHRAHLEWSPSRLIAWGQRMGPATAEVVTRILAENKHPEHGYRRCLGLLSLARQYGEDRLEAGCTVALQIGAHRYRIVSDILANNRDRAVDTRQDDWVSPAHENVRGPGYYQ